MDILFTLSLLLSLVFSLYGGYTAHKAFGQHSDISLENAHQKSKTFYILALLFLIAFALGAVCLQIDTLLEKTPLLFQRLSTLYTWSMFALFITFASGFALTLSYLLQKKMKSYLPSLLLLNLLFFILFFRINQPISDLIKVQVAKEKGYMQTTDFSCTSASVATIVLRSGRVADEKRIASLSGLTKFGATSGQLRYALDILGLGYETVHDSPKKLKALLAPVLIYIDHSTIGKEGHAVVYLDHNSSGYSLWDPLQGHRMVSDQEMDKIWHGNGIIVKG